MTKRTIYDRHLRVRESTLEALSASTRALEVSVSSQAYRSSDHVLDACKSLRKALAEIECEIDSLRFVRDSEVSIKESMRRAVLSSIGILDENRDTSLRERVASEIAMVASGAESGPLARDLSIEVVREVFGEHK